LKDGEAQLVSATGEKPAAEEVACVAAAKDKTHQLATTGAPALLSHLAGTDLSSCAALATVASKHASLARTPNITAPLSGRHRAVHALNPHRQLAHPIALTTPPGRRRAVHPPFTVASKHPGNKHLASWHTS
jgi:hypothetical protein